MDLIELNAFPSVAAGAISTLATDELRGKSVHGLVFERGGTFTNAHINNVRVRLDGKDIVNGITGAELVDINEYDGLVDVTNYTMLHFGDPTARTIRGQHLGDLDLSVYRSPLEIEVDIDAAATTPTLQVYALAGVPKLKMGVGFAEMHAAQFRALIRSIAQPSAAVSRQTYGVSLGSGAGGRIRRVHFFHSNLTSVEFKKQSLTKWDDVTQALNDAVQQQYARTPQAGLYVMDRIMDANQGEAENTVDSKGQPWNLQIALSTSGADTIRAFADMFLTHPQL